MFLVELACLSVVTAGIGGYVGHKAAKLVMKRRHHRENKRALQKVKPPTNDAQLMSLEFEVLGPIENAIKQGERAAEQEWNVQHGHITLPDLNPLVAIAQHTGVQHVSRTPDPQQALVDALSARAAGIKDQLIESGNWMFNNAIPPWGSE